MASSIFQRTVVDEQGNIVTGAVVEVRNELTDELAPIFVDRPLAEVKANPFTTDSTGFIKFFVGRGEYRIKATFGDNEIVWRFVQMLDTDYLVNLDVEQTLENKTLIEPNIETISNAGLLTLPAATDTLVGRATTDTLTNKTLTSPTINGGTITGITDLEVADGGTGRSTLTANNVLIGNGTSAVNFVAPGAVGNVLTSNGAEWISEPITGPGGVIIATQFEATGTGANIMPVGTTAQRPASPVEGMFRLNTTRKEPEWYDETADEWVAFRTAPSALSFSADFLVIAGGGGGGSTDTGGGAGGAGAGGYREFTAQTLAVATNFTITIGAGGAGALSSSVGTSGSNSVFNTTNAAGGGGGGGANRAPGIDGGSGGGGTTDGVAGAGNTPTTSPSQGNNGGIGGPFSGNFVGGGGGGASGVGGAGASTVAGSGGAGTASSITGSTVTRAGGGGGGTFNGGTNGTGGAGGGGSGGLGGTGTPTGTAGTVNLGGGGGGGGFTVPTNFGSGGSGGSGVVIVKYPDTLTITNPGGGLTSSTASAGGFKVTTFTAGTGTIQFN